MYHLQFYATASGFEPVLSWAEKLTPTKRRALDAALRMVLEPMGIRVCGTEFGRQLGEGLFEFRLRHTAEEVLVRFSSSSSRLPARQPEKILLRVFCHAYGDRIILLLGGYDKALHSAPRYQAQQIAIARRRLADFKRQQHFEGAQ